jgi:hypothetical protein
LTVLLVPVLSQGCGFGVLTEYPKGDPANRSVMQHRHRNPSFSPLLNSTALRIVGLFFCCWPKSVTECRDVRRGIKEPTHGPCEASLVTFAHVQQCEPFQRGKVAWPNLDLHQNPPMPAPLPERFASLSALVTAVSIKCFGHHTPRGHISRIIRKLSAFPRARA